MLAIRVKKEASRLAGQRWEPVFQEFDRLKATFPTKPFIDLDEDRDNAEIDNKEEIWGGHNGDPEDAE